MSSNKIPAVALFVYNRPDHVAMTLSSLKSNFRSSEINLYVFCDGAKTNTHSGDVEKIRQVQSIVQEIDWTNDLKVIFRDGNVGLFQNVVSGVSEVLETNESIVVLEDDLLFSVHFLDYMFTALSQYAETINVSQISGFKFPFESKKRNGSFFMPVTNTIGWGTWKNRWEAIDFISPDITALRRKSVRREFNLGNAYPYDDMLIDQLKNEKTGSWAILYWWHVFRRNEMVLYPDYSLVQHNDFDQSGYHSGNTSYYDEPNWDNGYQVSNYPEVLKGDQISYTMHREYVKANTKYILKKMKRMLKIFFVKLLVWER